MVAQVRSARAELVMRLEQGHIINADEVLPWGGGVLFPALILAHHTSDNELVILSTTVGNRNKALHSSVRVCCSYDTSTTVGNRNKALHSSVRECCSYDTSTTIGNRNKALHSSVRECCSYDTSTTVGNRNRALHSSVRV